MQSAKQIGPGNYVYIVYYTYLITLQMETVLLDITWLHEGCVSGKCFS